VPDEVLALVTDPEGERVLRHLSNGLQVSQWFSPRVAVVSGASAELESLAETPGVELIERAPAGDLPAWLDRAEALMARAWQARAATEKVRPGDGLEWDAAGFEPPDPPDGHGG
jgi:hypothetical protein